MSEDLTLYQSIRKRPAMYIGDLRLRGFHVMLGYFLSELTSVNKECIEVTFELQKNNKVLISATKLEVRLFQNILEQLTLKRKKYSNSSDYLTAIGIPVIASLSESVMISIDLLPDAIVVIGKSGEFKMTPSTSQQSEPRIQVEFTPDPEIFSNLQLNYNTLNQYLREFTLLNSNIRITTVDSMKSSANQKNIFYYPNGLSHELDLKIQEFNYFINPSVRFERNFTIGEFNFQVCLNYSYNFDKSYICTFANNDKCYDGGSLENGILEGIKKGVIKYADSKSIDFSFDSRKLRGNLILLAQIKGEEFTWAGAIKAKLQMPKMRKELREYVCNDFFSFCNLNAEIAENVMQRFAVDTN